MGAEVMGVDSREEAVNEIADHFTHSIIADTTEERVVEEMGVAQLSDIRATREPSELGLLAQPSWQNLNQALIKP